MGFAIVLRGIRRRWRLTARAAHQASGNQPKCEKQPENILPIMQGTKWPRPLQTGDQLGIHQACGKFTPLGPRQERYPSTF
jgi:hypothetical protein